MTHLGISGLVAVHTELQDRSSSRSSCSVAEQGPPMAKVATASWSVKLSLRTRTSDRTTFRPLRAFS